MAQTLKFGNKVWAAKEDSVLAYNDINNNYKPLPFSFSRASIGTRVNKDGLIETMGQDIARIDYTDSADGVLLLENSSTNLLTYSEDFSDSSWTKNNASISANTSVSPEGILNADLFTPTATNNIHYINKTVTTMTGGSLSFFVKSNGYNYVVINFGSSNGSAGFDLSNGTITSNRSDVINQSIESLNNGWYRISVSVAISLTNINISVQDTPFINQSWVESWTANGIDGVYIFGAQLEALTYPTSYIPTSGSSVTRAAETCNNSGNSEVFNDSEGVLFVNASIPIDDGTSRRISLTDGTINNRVSLEFDEAVNTLKLFIDSSVLIASGITKTNFNKISAKYKANDYALWVNGFEVATSTTQSNVPTGLDKLNFDNSTGANDFYGKTKKLGYYDTALTDAELETLTSYRNWVSMVNELNLNIIYNG